VDRDCETRANGSRHAVAHRGSYAGTENQVAGVDNALPCRRVEIDANVTKDGQIVVIHDARLMVTINKWGRIKGSGFAAQTLDRLYAAAQDQMRLRHTRTP
jgi:glycerophosphoryl diester phosphodiesterase